VRIVVTGGTGHLGRSIVAQLIAGGHQVRVLARQPGEDAAIEWVRGDLGTGEVVVEAVTGMGTVVHAATNSPAARRGSFRPTDFVRSPTDVDVDGTRALLAAAADASVEHFIHVSIVGLEHMARLPYSRVKLRAEELVRGSAVPWSIVRATGFYLAARENAREDGQAPGHAAAARCRNAAGRLGRLRELRRRLRD